MIRIRTARFHAPDRDHELRVSIARFQPNGFHYPSWSTVAPSYALLSEWNLGNLTAAEYTERYTAHLDRNRERVLKEFRRIVKTAAKNGRRQVTLVCWEQEEQFCHRNLLIRWLELNTQGTILSN